jgi:hypothetical protein
MHKAHQVPLRARARERERALGYMVPPWPGLLSTYYIRKSVFKVFVSWEGLCRLCHKCDLCTIKGKKRRSAYCQHTCLLRLLRMLTVSQHTYLTLLRMLTASQYTVFYVRIFQHTVSTRQHTASMRQHVFPFSRMTSAQYKEK